MFHMLIMSSRLTFMNWELRIENWKLKVDDCFSLETFWYSVFLTLMIYSRLTFMDWELRIEANASWYVVSGRWCVVDNPKASPGGELSRSDWEMTKFVVKLI